MITTGDKLYKEDGKEVTVSSIDDKFIQIHNVIAITVTHNLGNNKDFHSIIKTETFFVDDIGKKLFTDFRSTPHYKKSINEQIRLDSYNQGRKEALSKLINLFNIDYLSSRDYWKGSLADYISEEEFQELTSKFVLEWFIDQGWEQPDIEQSKCIANAFDNLLVIARAGSGKTSTIIKRVSFLIKHCDVLPEEILVLAFNREAANEVNKRLELLLGDRKPQAMTFHALAYGIVHPEENLIYDDIDSGLTKSKSVQEVIDSHLRDKYWHVVIKRFMLNYFRTSWDEIARGKYFLNQEDLINYRRSLPYIGLDGNYYKSIGEKKLADFLLEHNIQYLYEKDYKWDGRNYKPDFTIHSRDTKYKGIIIEYFGIKNDREYDNQIFQKREYWNSQSDYLFIEIFPEDNLDQTSLNNKLREPLINCGYELNRLSEYEIWLLIKDRAIDEFSLLVSQFIGRCRKELISPKDIDNISKTGISDVSNLHTDFFHIVKDIYGKYLTALEMNNEDDFDGLLIRACDALENGKTEWNRKSGIGNLASIRYLFIDEYQDFSKLFFILTNNILEKNRGVKLFCVGDDWQAINGFAGSNLKYIESFKEYYPDSVQLEITTNYRSQKRIVEVSNGLMKGKGIPSKGIKEGLGEVHIVDLKDFTPNDFEKNRYRNDKITPALIRIIDNIISKGQKVSILSRRRNSIPFPNSVSNNRRNFYAEYLGILRSSFPEGKRELIKDFSSAHSYKGKENDAIIVLDAIANSYPLIHPNNVFFEVLGSTIESITSEEMRLFYVALTRAKETLIIVTERGKETPFLLDNILENVKVEKIDLDRITISSREPTLYSVRVFNNLANTRLQGTYQIRNELKANKYSWDSVSRSWIKNYSSENFSLDKLQSEQWVSRGDKITVQVSDEFSNNVHKFKVEKGFVKNMY